MTLRHLLGVGCAMVALSASNAHATQADFSALAKSTPGLIGYWSFEGNYDDQSGMGNNVKANGDPSLIKFGAGVNGGQAVEMDNQTADTQFLAVAAPVGSTFDTPNQTVLVWSKSTITKNAGDYDNIIDRASIWYIDTAYADVNGALKSDLVARIYTPSTPAGGGSGQVLSSAGAPPGYITPGAWSLTGWTYDGKVMTTYIDGKPVQKVDYDGGLGPTADTPAVSDSPTGNYDLFWGAWRGEPGYSLTGSIDDTVIYNRALTDDEVKALFDAMVKAAPAPTQ
jgi:hypothetical protein